MKVQVKMVLLKQTHRVCHLVTNDDVGALWRYLLPASCSYTVAYQVAFRSGNVCNVCIAHMQTHGIFSSKYFSARNNISLSHIMNIILFQLVRSVNQAATKGRSLVLIM